MSLSSTLKRYIKFAIPKEAYSNELIDAIDGATSGSDTNAAAIAALDAAKQAKVLTGYAAAASPAADILATDTVLLAFGKIQTQMDDLTSDVSDIAGDVGDLQSDKQEVLTMGQDTTSAAGEVLVTNLTAATGKVVVVPAEAPGANISFSHVVVADGKFTVYGMDITGVVAGLNAKKVNYIVVSL